MAEHNWVYNIVELCSCFLLFTFHEHLSMLLEVLCAHLKDHYYQFWCCTVPWVLMGCVHWMMIGMNGDREEWSHCVGPLCTSEWDWWEGLLLISLGITEDDGICLSHLVPLLPTLSPYKHDGVSFYRFSIPVPLNAALLIEIRLWSPLSVELCCIQSLSW